MNKYKKEMIKKNCIGYIGGYFRSDFCHRDFRSIYDYSKIMQKYNLKKKSNNFFVKLHSMASERKL